MSTITISIHSRSSSKYWQCSISSDGKRTRTTTGLKISDYTKDQALEIIKHDAGIITDAPEAGTETVRWLRENILTRIPHIKPKKCLTNLS